jgi:hypothetical protein
MAPAQFHILCVHILERTTLVMLFSSDLLAS